MITTPPGSKAPLSLAIAISTLGDRLSKIQLPAARSHVTYLILVQNPPLGAEKAFGDRSDIQVHVLGTMGVANSRNAALDLAQSDLILFGDDDVIWNMPGILDVQARFQDDDDLALVLACRKEAAGAGSKTVTSLTRFNSGRAGAPEIMIRRSGILQKAIRFDPDFGLGATWPLGEEYVFVTDALAAGLKGLGTGDVTFSHPHPSTGSNWSDPSLLAARQALLKRVFGAAAVVVRPLYTLRHRRRFETMSQAVRFALGF